MTFHSISMKSSKVTIELFHNPMTQSHLIETYTSKAHVHSLVIRLSPFVIPLLLRPIAKFIISTTHNNSQFCLNHGIRLLCKSFPRSRRENWRRNISNMLKNIRREWMILWLLLVLILMPWQVCNFHVAKEDGFSCTIDGNSYLGKTGLLFTLFGRYSWVSKL